MPRKFIAGLVIGSICTITVMYLPSINANFSTSLLSKKSPYLHPKINVSDEAKWVTVEEIEQSLLNTPAMNVGFDIDDTVLFPHTSFHVAYQKFCNNDVTPLHTECTTQQKFWDHMNAQGELSPPKEIGKQLIDLHKRRGDKIFFITAREKSMHAKENLSETLRNTFKIGNMHEVIYLGMATISTETPGKTPSIIEHNIQLFYGDSDADIAAAKAANIRGIRVIRAPNSQDNHVMPLNGRYGEEVIIGSDV